MQYIATIFIPKYHFGFVITIFISSMLSLKIFLSKENNIKLKSFYNKLRKTLLQCSVWWDQVVILFLLSTVYELFTRKKGLCTKCKDKCTYFYLSFLDINTGYCVVIIRFVFYGFCKFIICYAYKYKISHFNQYSILNLKKVSSQFNLFVVFLWTVSTCVV